MCTDGASIGSNISPLRRPGELLMDSPLSPLGPGPQDGSFSNELSFTSMMNQGHMPMSMVSWGARAARQVRIIIIY